MGGACLRGHGHHWPAGSAGGVAVGRRQQGGLARKPDAAGPDARSHLLRAGGDSDAVRISDGEEQPDAVPDPHADAVAIGILLGKPIADRDHQRLSDSLSVAGRDADAITVAERQRETLGLALNGKATSVTLLPAGAGEGSTVRVRLTWNNHSEAQS